MPSAISRASKSRFSSRRNPVANRPQPTSPITVTSANAALAVLTVNFNQAVTLKGVPQYVVDVAGVSPVSAQLVTPTSMQVTYSATIAAATTVTIPYEEPAVRNASGGFVATSGVPLA